MKNLSFFLNAVTVVPPSNTSDATVSLHQLVSQLMNSFIPLAVEKRSFIVNDVDPALNLMADQQVLAFWVGDLLRNTISSTDCACIHIDAVRQADGLQIICSA